MTSDPSDYSASIHLDYDADSAPFDLQICQHGMSLRTRWFFEPGTELSVNFQLADPASGPAVSARPARILRTAGYVVSCDALRGNEGAGFEVTVAFWEVTDDILAVIRDVVPAAEFQH